MLPRRGLRLTAGAAGLAGALVAGIPSAHLPPGPEHPCPGATDAVGVKGQWTVIKAPPGLDKIVAHAAGGADGQVMLASDGRKVMRSGDTGCTWKETSGDALAELAGADDLPRISALEFPDGDGRLAFMVVDGVARAAGSRLMRSTDGGQSWEAAGSGLPLTTGLREIAGYDDRLYLTTGTNDDVDDASGQTGSLYASEDGGKTWTERSAG